MAKIRCPSCGGLNPEGAQWCGQCHARFPSRTAPPPPPAPVDTSTAASPTTAAPTAEEAADATVASKSTSPIAVRAVTDAGSRQPLSPGNGRPGFTVVDGSVRWICARCEADNDVNDAVCSVCGASFAETVRASEPEPPARDPGAAALWSLFLPGAGHAYAGNWGQAIARGVLSLWVLGMTLLAAVQGRGGPVNTFSVLFGIVAFGLWISASHDAYREARREPENVILKGRLFLYVVLALLGLVLVLVMSSVNQTAGV